MCGIVHATNWSFQIVKFIFHDSSYAFKQLYERQNIFQPFLSYDKLIRIFTKPLGLTIFEIW